MKGKNKHAVVRTIVCCIFSSSLYQQFKIYNFLHVAIMNVYRQLW